MFRPLAPVPLALLLATSLLAGCPDEREPSECASGLTRCGLACVDTATDAANCGGCGQDCGEGTCSGGTCTCDAAATECPGAWPRCVDALNDPANCGTCGYSCPLANDVCVAGECPCPATHPTECPVVAPTACVNLDTDEGNCGACGAGCRPGEACDGGGCACLPGYTDCTTACYDLDQDESHCGACTTACPTGATCSTGTCTCPDTAATVCGSDPGACVDLFTDEGHCGTCATACATGQTCTLGKCCASGQFVCGSTVRSCCDGTSCCADGSCQSKHSNGLGGFYWDCSPLGAPWTPADAVLAANAWGAGTDVNMSVTACPAACYGRVSTATGRCAIWCYDGSSYPGRVNEDSLCICPTDLDPAWN